MGLNYNIMMIKDDPKNAYQEVLPWNMATTTKEVMGPLKETTSVPKHQSGFHLDTMSRDGENEVFA